MSRCVLPVLLFLVLFAGECDPPCIPWDDCDGDPPEESEQAMVRRPTSNGRTPAHLFGPRVVYSGVSPTSLGWYASLADTYASETYSGIHELTYTISGVPSSANAWAFAGLAPHCGVDVDLLNKTTANLGPNGQLFPDLIVPFSRNAAGQFATIQDGTWYVQFNSVNSHGDLVLWPRVYYDDLVNQQYVFLNGGAAPGIQSPNAAALVGTMWVSYETVQQSTTGQNASTLRQIVLVHEMFHLVTEVNHGQEGAWWWTVQPLSDVQSGGYVWNGRLSNPGMDQHQTMRPAHLAPVSTRESGIWRSQCEALRQDVRHYFVY